MTMSHRWSKRSQAVGFTAGMLVASFAVFQTSSAAFNATTVDGSNTFAAGTVALVDDDAGSVMFELTGLVPGDSHTECIEVDYTGTTFAVTPVKLYAASDANVDNFADHLDVTVRQGTGGVFGDCTGFTPDATLTTDTPLSTLTSTSTDFASGLSGYTPVSGSTRRTYEFTVTLGTDTPNTAQGDSAAATFTWEIQTN